nr:MAG TPA: hypothetical protein [Caudoviricetes sp.]
MKPGNKNFRCFFWENGNSSSAIYLLCLTYKNVSGFVAVVKDKL